MRLDLYPGTLTPTSHYDDECRQIADRHYSRRTVGARQFAYSGRKLVLRDAAGLILYVWMNPDPTFRMDGQTGYNCALFRNESDRRSSDIIVEAVDHACAKWGPDRCYTYVDPTQVRSTNPGYCYLMAGWRHVHWTKTGKRLLAKDAP